MKRFFLLMRVATISITKTPSTLGIFFSLSRLAGFYTAGRYSVTRLNP
jgi:hypothetical protein